MNAFIDGHKEAYGIKPICRVLPIVPSTYHEADALKPEILRVFNENFAVYGANKIWRQMQREGFDVARCTLRAL